MKRALIFLALGMFLSSCGKGCGGKGPNQSCPFVFLWDGERYEYHTDLAGSVLGAGVDLFKPEHYDGGLYELGAFAARNGLYKMKVRETIHEADYFDEARLVVVDVPAGYRALSTWSFTSQLGRRSPKALVTVKDPRPPIAAVDARGIDVLHEVSHLDEVPLPVTEAGRSSVIVDFGPVARPEHAKLVVTAWSHYRDLSALQRPPHLAGTKIETPDGRGGWVVRKVAGKNPGDRRTWVIDISDIPTTTGSRMRITMAHQPIGLDVLDQVLLDDSAPVAMKVTRVAPHVADLHHGGSADYVPSTLVNRIHCDDARNPDLPEAKMTGSFTRYGDVRPLLATADDRFVVMAHGDELTLEFREPPPAPGRARWVFLEADVFYTIKHSVWGPLTDSIDPLPFHGMKRYPYDPADWPYRDDADYGRYLETWNTRRID
jgi:hypothetical protein